MGGGKGGGDDTAAQMEADDQAKQQQIQQGTAKVNNIFDSQFTPAYYDSQKQAYLDYATPQLTDQFNDAQKQLTYALARSGTLDSSERSDQAAQLQKEYDQNQQQIADQALSYEGQAQNNVEDARSGLISMLNTTGDASGAAQQAIARASALTQPTAYSPLGSLFGDFTTALGAQVAAEKAQALSGGTYTAPFNTGLFSSAGAVQNTG